NIKEKLACDEIENLSKFSNAVSNFEGVIRKINLISGTLAVKVGDTIKEGDVLVFPYYVAANGEKVKINPLATFEIDSWVTGVVNHFENRMENVKTGKKILNQYLCLNNKIVYSKTSTNSFDQFIKETSTQNFSNFLILPFKIRKEIIFETVTKEICEPFETYKNQIYAKAKEIAFKKLDKSAIIKNERTETSFEKGFITVAHIIELSVCFEV
ncbi:MAG: sporulation protein YqfD, partial [Clostridia bacterium]